MSGGTRHSSAVSPGGHRTLGDGQHSDNVTMYSSTKEALSRKTLGIELSYSF